ncbi:hypothetical protein [Virgibacillus pantothenticus]|nr:hypothetical protein [Virgibacillus pantothenticus]
MIRSICYVAKRTLIAFVQIITFNEISIERLMLIVANTDEMV